MWSTDRTTPGRTDFRSGRPDTAAAWNTSAAAPARSSSAHDATSSRSILRRKARSAAEWYSPEARAAGVHTHSRTVTAPTNSSRATNHTNRTTPNPHPTRRPAPVSPLIATAEMLDGAPT